MKPIKEKVSISLDPPVLEKIKQLAEDTDRNVSLYINMVLKQHIKALEEG